MRPRRGRVPDGRIIAGPIRPPAARPQNRLFGLRRARYKRGAAGDTIRSNSEGPEA